MAKVLGVNRKTVVRKFLFLSLVARQVHRDWLSSRRITQVQFDEAESFEHTRLKPLTIAVAVDGTTRRMLAARVATIPYKGKLARLARAKYGPRKNRRAWALRRCLKRIQPQVLPQAVVTTDGFPAYPEFMAKYLPQAQHRVVFPVKKNVWSTRRNPDDPLFAVNHLSARIRHDLSRMGRKVWVTTKKACRLQAHLDLFLAYHNGYVLPV